MFPARKNEVRTGASDPGYPGLTPIQQRIARFIEDSQRRKGYPPSIREIGDAVGLASTSSVAHQLSALKAKGIIVREARRPRTAVLRVAGQDGSNKKTGSEDDRVTDVRVVGRIAAGVPVYADEVDEDVIPLPRMLTGREDSSRSRSRATP